MLQEVDVTDLTAMMEVRITCAVGIRFLIIPGHAAR